MRTKVLFLLFVLSLIIVPLFADTILLKSGKQVEGSIVEQAAKSVKLETEGAGYVDIPQLMVSCLFNGIPVSSE